MTSEAERWRERRSADAAARAAAAERAQAVETAAARELLDAFRAELLTRGVLPEPLRATDGRWTFRTGVTGWYLRANRSVGLGEDGQFYVLTAALPLGAALRARALGIDLAPADPPLQIGRGARDGESIGLAELLALRLQELGHQQDDAPPSDSS